MNELHDALEACLKVLARGESMRSALERYPRLAPDLAPLLEAALIAQGARRPAVPHDVIRRRRAAVLHTAAQMRAAPRSRLPRMIPSMPRLAITLGLVAVLVVTSTRLVSASTGALPGDGLYSVKRSWEGLQLLFVIHAEDHYQLESQFDQERLDEIDDLLGKRRAAPIEFSGLLMDRQDETWLVSGIPVSISASTNLPAGVLSEGVPMAVVGITGSDGTVEASSVRLLGSGAPLPPLEPSERSAVVHNRADQNPGGPAGQSVPQPSGQTQPGVVGQVTYEFTGVVESMGATVWRINGQNVHVDEAQISGMVHDGSLVKFQGYYTPDSKFVATKIDLESSPGHGSGKNGGDGAGGSDGGTGGGTDGGGSGDSEPHDGGTGGGTGD